VGFGETGKLLRHIQVAFEGGSVAGLTDRQLVERFASRCDPGGEAAFAALMQRHGPMVLRVCRGVLRNHADAQDAFQATFLILAQKAGKLWVRDSVGPWLHGVACRVAACSKASAARRRRHERTAAGATARLSDGRDGDHDDLIALLHEELVRLPERYRAPIVLCDLEGQTYEAAARQLGCPMGTVKSRLARGRDRLRYRILRRGKELSPAVLTATLATPPANSSVSPAFIDATTRLIAGLNAGGTAMKVGPAAIFGLVEGARKMIFVSKLKAAVSSVAIGCGLFSVVVLCSRPGPGADDSSSGQGPMEATSYRPSSIPAPKPRTAPSPDEPGMLPPAPRPWETVVRMRIHGKTSVGFGSGTIIDSNLEYSVVLTSAHLFKIDGLEHIQPASFPYKIEIDLFDGKLSDSKPAKVHLLETVAGELLDPYFDRDVALVRIRPGRLLATSPIVPPRWGPQAGMRVLTVGCSEGNDATAWHTKVTKVRVRNFLQGNPTYEAIECETAPKQGRSGGGLFTDDGYLAGVCNYADPTRNRGLYATPGSIYALLERNGLAFDESRLDEKIREWEAAIERETQKLRKWERQQRERLQERRSQARGSATPAGTEPGIHGIVPAEPAEKTPDSADHERRLRELERKLEQILKLLAGAKTREPNSVR
jgi:RNA polymerase sigma factor (sigma-70 family)